MRTSVRVAAGALLCAALAQLLGSAIWRELNLAALIVVLVFVGLAGLAATGRTWALSVVALLSALLTILAIGQATERIEEDDVAELLGVLGFQTLTLTATIASMAAVVQNYRSRDSRP